jgi:hypothetical protein
MIIHGAGTRGFFECVYFLQLKHAANPQSLPCCCTMPKVFQRVEFRPAWFLRNENTRSASFGNVCFNSFSITCAFSELELDGTILISPSRSLMGVKFVLCLNEICLRWVQMKFASMKFASNAGISKANKP